ncbi:retinal guanylyl cyclase 1-like protein [Dinothrombium tinctorium]|uniref:guanylate cyclase n=1 Tax=Dinothrombium tinctorium TaxID=1965070 RepID=A0A3S3RWY1_9ACAR|nr:retinal guanylyl cyclase 1-like protein [Dinothrombium tinctorium]
MELSFKMLMLFDIVKGMCFIQKTLIKIHGNLNSHNCIVDNHFHVKLTNFGLGDLLHLQKFNMCVESEENLLWFAPELLRSYCYASLQTITAASDVYSFAIIMSELINDHRPFATQRNQSISISELIERLKNPSPLVRPVINDKIDCELIELVEHCWREEPKLRPNFEEINEKFIHLTKKW